MSSRHDLTDQSFGPITAVKIAAGRDPRGGHLWHVRCECGRELVLPASKFACRSRIRQYCTPECGLRRRPEPRPTPQIPHDKRPIVPRPVIDPTLRGKAARIQELQRRLWQELLDRGLIRPE